MSATDETSNETLTCLSCLFRERSGGRWPTSRCGNSRSPRCGAECLSGMFCNGYRPKWQPAPVRMGRALSEELL